MNRLIVNEGINNCRGNVNASPVASGTNSSITIIGNDEVIGNVDFDIEEDLEDIKKLLSDINSKLLEYKVSLNELIVTVATTEAELRKENPNKEKIKSYLKDSFSVAQQATGTMNNLLNILEALQLY